MKHQTHPKLDLPAIQAGLQQQIEAGGKPERIWVAVSGGLDSSVLLFLLDGLARKLGTFELGLLHVNYALRGAESDRDEDSVRKAAAAYGRELRVLKIDPQQQPQEKTGIQEWARALRYEWFARQQGPRDWIALAHHRNDWVETIFARLCRGHSLLDVTGMQVLHERLWRPLLDLTREQLEQIAIDQPIAFTEDSSNHSLDYTRNRLRLQIIPELEKLFPGFARNVWQHAQDLQDALRLLQEERAPLPLQPTLGVAELQARPPFLARHEINRYLQAEVPGVRVSRELLLKIHAALVQGSTWTAMLEPGTQAICQQGRLSLVRNRMPENERWQQFRAALLDESLDVWPSAAP